MKMESHLRMKLMVFLVLVFGISSKAYGSLTNSTMRKIIEISKNGTYMGIVVPNFFELNPLLQSPSFVPDQKLPYLDFGGTRFRFGRLENRCVIVVMTGSSMFNAGITTKLLLFLFNVKAVVHFGIAGNADPHLQIGDVAIPHYWAHTGLRNWETFGDGPNNELSLESFGDNTREVGHLKFSDFNNKTKNGSTVSNLPSIWYQPEEIFPVHGTPEVRQQAFWVPVNQKYFALAKKLEVLKLKLGGCVNTTCLPRAPIVVRVKRGISANVFVDNIATKELLKSKFNATLIDMESAAVAFVCHEQEKPFIVIRALSDLTGTGGSSASNETHTVASLAAQNAVDVVIRFIGLLSS